MLTVWRFFRKPTNWTEKKKCVFHQVASNTVCWHLAVSKLLYGYEMTFLCWSINRFCISLATEESATRTILFSSLNIQDPSIYGMFFYRERFFHIPAKNETFVCLFFHSSQRSLWTTIHNYNRTIHIYPTANFTFIYCACRRSPLTIPTEFHIH